jgi:hypothetical protein
LVTFSKQYLEFKIEKCLRDRPGGRFL